MGQLFKSIRSKKDMEICGNQPADSFSDGGDLKVLTQKSQFGRNPQLYAPRR